MKSLNKALDVLEILLNLGGSEIRLSELAQMTGLNKATVSRIVSALVKRGYMHQVERRGKYVLGTKFLDFSAVIKQKNRIKDVAMPHLIKLNRLVEEAAALFSFDGERAIFVEEVHSKHPLKITPDPTSSVPLYCTGVGKILLASKTAQELEKYFNNTDIRAFTPNTITEFNHLKSHLMTVAKEGVAYDDEEFSPGYRMVAAGIRDAGERLIGGIGVMGPAARLTPSKMKEIAPYVKYCAMEISMDLGYRESKD